MSGEAALRLQLTRAAVERFLAAQSSREAKLSVSEVARAFGFGRGEGLEKGLRAHRCLFGDPEWIFEEEVVEVPFPLAWRFRFGWLYGVADKVLFVRGVPTAVIEVKSYREIKRGERVQASLYALLALVNLGAKPRAFVETPGGLVEVVEWEELALSALERVARARRPPSAGWELWGCRAPRRARRAETPRARAPRRRGPCTREASPA